MTVTVTLNPAVDQTIFIERLALGGVNRFRASQLDPASKGINVSRIVHHFGWPTITLDFAAGEVGMIVRKAFHISSFAFPVRPVST